MNETNKSYLPAWAKGDVSSREIVSSRVFDAPVELVWKAWSTPEILKVWWGPKGFTNDFYHFEFKTGGEWQFDMIGPDGKRYKNHSIYREIKPNELIVLEHLSGPYYFATIKFEKLGSKTKLTWNMVFESQDAFNSIKDIAVQGNTENFDRLEEQLKKIK